MKYSARVTSEVLTQVGIPHYCFQAVTQRCIALFAPAADEHICSSLERQLAAYASELARRRRAPVSGAAPETFCLVVNGQSFAIHAHLISDVSQGPVVIFIVLPASQRAAICNAPTRTDTAVTFSALGLTPSEQRIASEVATGDTSPVIAARLGVTVHTVRRHTERVFAKLGVKSRAELSRRVGESRTGALG
jgi:DNA-binding CsgD family transcriptional regulator